MEETRMNADCAIKDILSGNNEFVQSRSRDYFVSHMNGQNPIITMVTCSDSRVQPNVLLPDAINRIFTIENIGNQILTAEGSVDYGIYHLRTSVLLILGHSDCGAIKAVMAGYDKGPGPIKAELDRLRQAISPMDKKSDPEKRLLDNIMKNIDHQVDEGVEKYNGLVRDEKLAVVGAFYDFRNELGEGYGRLVVINVNGETDRHGIERSPLFAGVGNDLIFQRVGP